MIDILRKLRIGQRVWMVVAVFSLASALGTALMTLNIRELTVTNYHSAVDTGLDTAMRIMRRYHAMADEGRLPTNEAKTYAAEAIRAIRYLNDGYLDITDTWGTVVMNPVDPDLEGSDAMDRKDANGEKFVAHYVNGIEDAGGKMTVRYA
ncbi:MAG: cache domain-containing protein, partial [Ectothiorhodospiraceae bacterium]